MVIYLDVYFFINFLADALLLKLVQKSMGQMRKNRWILLGAAVGGGGACCLLLCRGHQFWEMAGCLLLAMLMCWVSFGWKNGKTFLRELLVLYGFGLLLGGALGAIATRWPYGIVKEAAQRHTGYLPLAVWLAAVFGCYGVLRLFMKLYGEYRIRPQKLKVTIVWGDRRWELTGIVDTGNTLRNPGSGEPVIVVQKDILESEGLDSFLMASGGEVAAGLCVIPYQAVGKKSGVLLGFRPDYVMVGNRRNVNTVVALTDQVFDTEEDYQVLLHPDLTNDV
ncbi:sigma-E processing peptidase SpoIIGA [Bianquea renquensis]|uniref:Sporulation sigma-E factor-processing peptidase n=1 Tax=Bianquea renquensis TaxID=2763661 RepID=A0A926HXI7_9FIRM|nr:sigma-E processing peptidase SpoIIGA [Bianquea renquensis]MBC8543812.1 sigma-E processing peptidase SpoIIGA [Bianquea renquensis]